MQHTPSEQTPFEVELKFSVQALGPLRNRLEQLGARLLSRTKQSDEYLNDPLRDFANADKALRLRCVETNPIDPRGLTQADAKSESGCEQFWLTFKGPNQGTDVKIRTEIETPLINRQVAQQIRATFLGIGLFSVATVTKHRETLQLDWEQAQVEVCLDEVDEVGAFVELERVILDEGDIDSAKSSLLALADRLELNGSVRQSYLEMLLRNRGQL